MRWLIGSFLLAALATGCGGAGYGSSNNSPTGPSSNPSGGSSTSSSISVGNNFFDPSATTVPVGTTVTWTWNTCDVYGASCVSHNVVFDDGTKSGLQSTGTYQRTFTVAGTYPYHCSVHGTSMSGSVTVK